MKIKRNISPFHKKNQKEKTVNIPCLECDGEGCTECDNKGFIKATIKSEG